jgi:protein-L-isoaspartate(D-aspartate) O-methyltransferase
MTGQDTYRHKGLRRRLIDELRELNIADARTLEAMLEVPRHLFFPDQAFVEKAYEDIAFKIGAGQTISHPSTVAFQSALISPKRGEKILEIGTGSGYQTAVLVQLGARVFSIERQHELHVRTKKLLDQMGISARLSFGDGYLGLPGFAPFDKILVTAGAPFIPQPLIDQLKPGGRLVIPVGKDGTQEMVVVDKAEDGSLSQSVHGEFRFVPLLEDRN